MAAKNKLFAEGLAETLNEEKREKKRADRIASGVLSGRNNRLSELASGAVVNRALELVDPAKCRMWPGHNRDYEALTEERCSDLIESLKAQGKQEVPGLVRRLQDDSEYDFEVIFGARRHWSISWLRANNYPDFRFLVEIRDISDEEAFRISDLENRAREDISDYERAHDYLRALDAYYGGKQKAMAERLNVTPSWLSRYLDLARLPSEVIDAFPSPHVLGIKHVTQLKPILKDDDQRKKVLKRSQQLKSEKENGKGPELSAADVVRELSKAAKLDAQLSPKKTGKAKREIKTAAGHTIIRVDRSGSKAITLTVFPKGGGNRRDAEAAFDQLLEEFWA